MDFKHIRFRHLLQTQNLRGLGFTRQLFVGPMFEGQGVLFLETPKFLLNLDSSVSFW